MFYLCVRGDFVHNILGYFMEAAVVIVLHMLHVCRGVSEYECPGGG